MLPSPPAPLLVAAMSAASVALLMRGTGRSNVTVTVMSCWVARGREREVKGSKVRLTVAHSLQVTSEQSWPWKRSTTQERLRWRCCCHAQRAWWARVVRAVVGVWEAVDEGGGWWIG